MLQQSLPFTVLKQQTFAVYLTMTSTSVATVLTVHGIETNVEIRDNGVEDFVCCNSPYRSRYWNFAFLVAFLGFSACSCCNSTYRLWYAPKGARQQRSRATMRSAHLKCLNEVKAKQSWQENMLTIYSIETQLQHLQVLDVQFWWNSTYRLRYWNLWSVFSNTISWVATVLMICDIRRRVWDCRIMTMC